MQPSTHMPSPLNPQSTTKQSSLPSSLSSEPSSSILKEANSMRRAEKSQHYNVSQSNDENDQQQQKPCQSNQVVLEPFVHQVGGHFPMVVLDQEVICKPLKDREHKFYKSLPYSLRPFVPAFLGTMRVDTVEDKDGYITLYGQPPPNYQHLSPRLHRHNALSSKINCQRHYRLKRKESVEFESVEETKADVIVDNMPPSIPSRLIQLDASSNLDFGIIFFNPWALKCHRNHLKKMGLLRPSGEHQDQSSSLSDSASSKKSQHGKPQMYLLLENMVAKYKRPCVLDLKVGTRQYADYVSSAKKQRKIDKAAQTTSCTLGLRLCGLQVFKTSTGTYTCQDKYFGRTLNPSSFKAAMKNFFHDGQRPRDDIIRNVIHQLQEMIKAIEALDSFRFYTSSLLVTYDGIRNTHEDDDDDDLDVNCNVGDVRVIDFAHATHRGFRDTVLHEGPDQGFLFGVKNFVRILETIVDESVTTTDEEDTTNTIDDKDDESDSQRTDRN